MASKQHPKFDLDYEWLYGESGWNVEMDNNIKELALFTQGIFEAITNTAPTSPINGETHIVGVAPTGIFAGLNNQVAIYLDSAWKYYIPAHGYVFYNKTDNQLYRYTGSAWSVYAPAGSGDMLKSVYDTADTGVIDEATKVSGVDTAGADQYYGTDINSAVGYYPLPAGVGAQSIGYSNDVDVVTNVPVLNSILRFNGTDWVPANLGTNNLRLAFSFIGQLTDAEPLAIYQVVDPITLPQNLTGSSCNAGVTSLGSVVMDIQKNNASIGLVHFTGATATATFTFVSAISFVAGDRITLVAPAVHDTSLGDISLTLLATL